MTAHRESDIRSRSLSRRGVLSTGMWSVPVVALAVASPAAAASDDDPVLTSYGPVDVDSHTKVFGLALSNLPDLPPSQEGRYEGVMLDLCLPVGLAVLSVSPGWAFAGSLDDIYEGGDCYVWNTGPIDAGSATIEVTVALDPTRESLEGILGADISIADDYLSIVSWTYLYGASTGVVLPNCAAPENLG
ncbi:hypothetical protein [Herbiconiux sp. UC225_62]|uniref:hypothetical protein n=1 Tax=Herbiconiux sp. UC225_62 TaxID=3350168 RepID=UPI0036D27FFD